MRRINKYYPIHPYLFMNFLFPDLDIKGLLKTFHLSSVGNTNLKLRTIHACCIKRTDPL